MWRSCVIVLLSLQLSSLLWSTVSGLQCYKCNSFLTPSCAFAGNTDEWATCEDDLCFTAIMSGQFLGFQTTAVMRDCNNTAPATGAFQIKLITKNQKVAGQCDHRTEHVDYLGLNLLINSTVCACTTPLCNAVNITLGGTAATGTPPSTSTHTTLSRTHNTLPELPHFKSSHVPTSPTVQYSSTTASRGKFAPNGYATSTQKPPAKKSSAKSPESYQTLIVAVFLAITIRGH